MDRPQLICRLRIAVSALFAVVTVLLCVLWVRSYSISDTLRGPASNNSRIWINSLEGRVNISAPWRGGGAGHWTIRRTAITLPDESLDLERFFSQCLRFEVWHEHPIRGVIVPYLFLVLLAGICAFLPWASYRFSLRTLLIATTLVAVVLGLAMWATG